MEDITPKKTQQPKKLVDLQDEIIVAQNKAISALEDNVRLLREQIEFKEKILKSEFEVRDASYVIPAKNGASSGNKDKVAKKE